MRRQHAMPYIGKVNRCPCIVYIPVCSHCQGFDQRADIKVHIFWESQASLGRHDNFIADTAPASRQANKPAVQASILRAVLTSCASCAVDGRLDRDLLADLEAGRLQTFTELLDGAGELVTDGDGYCLFRDWMRRDGGEARIVV